MRIIFLPEVRAGNDTGATELASESNWLRFDCIYDQSGLSKTVDPAMTRLVWKATRTIAGIEGVDG